MDNTLQELGALTLFDDKRLLYEFDVEVTLRCPQFDFATYPFDEQVCKLLVGSYQYNKKQNIYTGYVDYHKEDQRPLQYDVKEIKALTFEEGLTNSESYYYKDDGKMEFQNESYSHFGVKMTFNRLIQPHLLCTFLPSALLVLSSWLGFLIDPAAVPGRIALSVMLLLVLTNMR